jgi:hypothetical protein
LEYQHSENAISFDLPNSVTFSLLFPLQASAATLTIIEPIEDGIVYFNGTVSLIGGDDSDIGELGDLHFAAFDSSQYSLIQLELNPYAEPCVAIRLRSMELTMLRAHS